MLKILIMLALIQRMDIMQKTQKQQNINKKKRTNIYCTYFIIIKLVWHTRKIFIKHFLFIFFYFSKELHVKQFFNKVIMFNVLKNIHLITQVLYQIINITFLLSYTFY